LDMEVQKKSNRGMTNWIRKETERDSMVYKSKQRDS